MSTFKQIYNEYEKTFRQQLLDKLYDLTPYEFEHFARKLLDAYGFVEAEVTQASRDGGIDGHGKIQLGLATMNAAFQCKRWKGNIGRPEIDKFRGAIVGVYEQGIFFTTGDYTEGAKDVSIRKGTVPIILLNGEGIVDLMIDKELGVERMPLYIFRERLSDFMIEEDDEEAPISEEDDVATETNNYDEAFYKRKYNPQSVEYFFKYAKEVEGLISDKGWLLDTAFRRYYCSFKSGFFNAFGIRWIGQKTFAFFANVTEDEAKQFKIPFTRYTERRKQAYYYIDPQNTNTEDFTSVFELAYQRLLGETTNSNQAFNANPQTDYTGRVITAFSFDGQRYETRSWRQMLAQLCGIIYDKHEAEFEKVFTLVGRTRSYLARNPEELTAPIPIGETGIFVEGNIGVKKITNLSRQVISLFGYAEDSLTFETQET